MKRLYLSHFIIPIIILIFPKSLYSQNVGIGITSPTAKLHVGNGSVRLEGPSSPGGVSLSIGGYGDVIIDKFGMPGGRFTILENGYLGLGTSNPLANLHVKAGDANITPFVNSQLTVESNGQTYINLLSPNQETGVLFGRNGINVRGAILYDAADAMEFRTSNNTMKMKIDAAGNVGIGTANPSRKLQVDGISYFNGYVGIQNNNPTAPLSMAPELGKKIILYPGAIGDAGFGIAGNRLQIFSDNPNADVAIGYDAAGVFNERLAVKPNGSLAINGNLGLPGQLLQSNGGGGAATWVNKPSVLSYSQSANLQIVYPGSGTYSEFLPGIHDQYFTLAQNSRVMISGSILVYVTSGNTEAAVEVLIQDASNIIVARADTYQHVQGGWYSNIPVSALAILPAGTYHTRAIISSSGGNIYAHTSPYFGKQGSQLFLQIFPD